MSSPEDATDSLEHLMTKAAGGDRRAYAEALRRSTPIIRQYLSRRVSNTPIIEDIVQEILLSVHKARHTYDGQRPFKPWLFAIARYRLQDYLRVHYKDQLYHATDLGLLENSLSADVTESPLSYESLKEEIMKLPAKQATILQLIHEEGYTAKETAQKLGMGESAVKVSAHRAYKLLKKKLEQG